MLFSSTHYVQEKLLQRGISEKGIERGEAVERILGAEGSNTTRYTQLTCPRLIEQWRVLLQADHCHGILPETAFTALLQCMAGFS